MARFASKALPPILLCWLCGCVTPQAPAPSSAGWFRNLMPQQPAADAIQIDAALIERPIGDPFLNREIWGCADQLVVDLERRDLLESNGFRVGQIVGVTPAKLQELLRSERWCLNPRRRMAPAGSAVQQLLGPELPSCSYEVKLPRKTETVELEKVRFQFELTPTLAADNKTRLRFVPKAENAEAQLPFEANPDQAAWTLRVDRAARVYPELAWEVDLAPHAYLIVGADLDQPNSLAYRAFVQETDGRRVQRLLILRTARQVQGSDSSEPTLEDIARSSSSPPLAAQAARASRP